VVAERDVVAVQARLGKVVVSFDGHDVVALGQDGPVPGGFHADLRRAAAVCAAQEP
jgi:hypothetical protein